eukprot:TRINITY_DN9267_c0_g1_i5.p1 TRINITY_DN9267_c0_g1~~TRINITY_DN9267_c0_g1_i5.p1  ORF type:complete len:955 (+),score=372.38 TRINITY_DN9267_c0_g1_i5:20-2884(+)
MASNVKVCCRFRPQLPNELSKGGVSIVNVDPAGTSCVINGTKKASFTFDRVFGDDSTQEGVYEYTAKPIVEDVLKGYNGTIFAYGQTSSGKTHTMEGPDVDGSNRGIIPRIVYNIFSYIDMAPESLEFTVRVSYFEIYMERIRDLLCDGNVNLQIHENRDRGVYVRHATELYMQDPEDVMEVMRAGAERRSVASTNMNDISSRSHSVFLMEITQKDTLKGGVKTGKLFLVDLAGSEKVSKTGADGAVLDEAKNINKSLSALGLVIMSLTEGHSRQHVPYRDSKLTRILQESLGGNARTTIIICCSPSSYNEQETISTLRFGQRAKKIKNKARVNVQYSAEELTKQLDQAKKEISKLAKRLAAAEAELEVWRSGGTVSEADRAELGSKARTSLTDDDEGSGGGQGGASAEELAILEQQKEELLTRETELLDLLDEKDEHIASLETELDSTGQDKVTITQLAAENAQLRENLKDSEEREEELTAENGEFEAAIEEMAEVNTQCQIELEELVEAKEQVEAQLNEQRAHLTSLSQRLADNLALISANAGAQVEQTGVAVCDAQLARLQETMLQLQQEAQGLKEAEEARTTELNTLQSASQESSKQVAELRTTNAQLEEKNAALSKSKTQLEEDLAALKAKYDKSSQEYQEKMAGLLANQQASSAAKESEAIRAALESERDRQQQEHQAEVAELREKITAVTGEMDSVKQQLDAKDVELQGALAEVQAQASQLAEKEQKLAELSKSTTQKEEQTRKAKTVEQGAAKTFAAFEQFKSSKLTSIRSLMEKQKATLTANLPNVGANAGPGATPSAHEARIHNLTEQNDKLKADLKETQAQLKQARSELSAQTKASQQRKGRIARLEKQCEDTQRRLEQQLEYIKSNSPRKHSTARPQKKEAVPINRRRGGSRVLTAQDKQGQQFWKSNTSGVAGQGQPMVGNYAAAKAQDKAAEELVTPEFV